MAKSSLEKMKERFKKTKPKIPGRMNLENMNQIRNFVFGKKKSLGIDDDVQGIALQKAKKKIADSKKKKTTPNKKTLGKSPGALGGKVKKPLGKSPGALGGKVTPTVKKDKKVIKVAPKTDAKSKVKATAANTKNYASTLAMQKRLKKLGANINADGIMGPKTRAAIKKYIKNPSTLKKNKSKVMVDDFKKSKVKKSASKTGIDGAATNKKKSSKTGLGSKAMSTKTPKTYKGTNITPTKLQRERMRKRMMGST